jgi:hypothetical protein
MRTTQVMMTSPALAPIHQSHVRTWRQPLVRAKKPTRMRIIIFIRYIKRLSLVASDVVCMYVTYLFLRDLGDVCMSPIYSYVTY